jgi:hypothetical protein
MSGIPARAGRRRAGISGLAAVMAFAGMSIAGSPPALANNLVSETFANDSTPAGLWSAPSPKGAHTPCLTAAATQPPTGSLTWCNAVRNGTGKPDPVGSGVFQVTDNSANDAGALILDQAFNARAGLDIKFDTYQYNTTTSRGADGISFFLIDGATANPTVGDSGGWLGYRNLAGAFVGVGFDEYGNFSYNRYWGSTDKGPSTAKPNSVVIRGSEATKYQYVTGVQAPVPLAVDKTKTRADAKRTVHIAVSTANVMTIGIDFHDGKGDRVLINHLDLDNIPGQPHLPSTVKLGFAASTGSATNYHEIGGFSLATLDPNLNIKVSDSGGFQAGGSGSYTINVANSEQAGPTVGRVTTTLNVPDGLTPIAASGDGWTCTTSGQTVTCIRPGRGPDALGPGASYPPVKVDVAIPAGAPDSVTTKAQVDTMNEWNQADNVSAPVTTIVAAATPDLTPTYTADGPTVTGTVTNKGNGPNGQPAKLTFTVPQGAQVDKVQPGTGWTCAPPADGKIVCTHNDPIKPGDTTAPVKVTFGSADGTALTGTSTATSTTPNDARTDNDTSPQITVTIPAKGPDLTPTITTSGATVTGTVSNATGAGPTTTDIPLEIAIPDGAKVAKSDPGTGWTCNEGVSPTTGKPAVLCTRPGSGTDTLKGGDTTPPVKVTFTTTDGAPLKATTTAGTGTPDDTNTGNNTSAPATVDIPATPPDLTPTYTATGPTATGTITNSGGGPSTQPATLTFTIPQGATVAKVNPGTGWTCANPADSKLICTHPDPIKPGDTTTPVKVTFGSADGSPVTGQSMAIARTPDDANPSNNASAPITIRIPATPPDLAPTLTASGMAVTATVTNAEGAGPTTTDIPLEIPIPNGTAVTKIQIGMGWNCWLGTSPTTGNPAVLCTRPGSGADALKGGDTTPGLRVFFTTLNGAAFTGTTTGTTTVPDDTNTGNNTSPPVTITIPANPYGSGSTNPYGSGPTNPYGGSSYNPYGSSSTNPYGRIR